ncbi:hypothetical protein [Nonomuraea rhizosphaerae]|uniref:hypothetical protein n=1 Tax=Nonomuraea rhizosphaerae TaxID=2665663 RepID=UPI001C601DAF|nr:hypothetical protein [Nonomuraea rhizosphaerae]
MNPAEQRQNKEQAAHGMAAMVALVTAWRGEHVSLEDFAELVARTVADIQAEPNAAERLCWLVYQLAAGAGDLCEQWNQAVGGAPAEAWLAEAGELAALDLVEVSGV